MKHPARATLGALVLLLTGLPSLPAADLNWSKIQKQSDSWYSSQEARSLAQNVLAWQFSNGGWPKNTDMSKAPPADRKDGSDHGSTIDNGATCPQIRFLARYFKASNDSAARDAALRGIQYLFTAQYANGGWPQFYPLRKGYWDHITFNDNAMVNVMILMREIASGTPTFDWIDKALQDKAKLAFAKGIDCILKCQVVAGGKKTVWCAQHDENTFAAAPARKFEPASLSGAESVGIVKLLMEIERPSPAIIEAVEAAVAWFKANKIEGIRFQRVNTANGKDGIVVNDPSAPPTWARFYEIGTNRPIFTGRDTQIHYVLTEVEQERRGGYSWYTESPGPLIEVQYPAWTKRLAK